MLYSGVFTCCNQGGRVLSPWNLSVELPPGWVGEAKKILNYPGVLTPYFLWLFSGADTLLRKFILFGVYLMMHSVRSILPWLLHQTSFVSAASNIRSCLHCLFS